MKKTILTLLLMTVVNFAYSKDLKTSSSQLTKQEINSIFTHSLKTKLKIDYGIYRVYKYKDKGGKHLLVMTENKTQCESEDQKECFDAIKAFCFNVKGGQYIQEWQLNDFMLPNGNEVDKEKTITFWTKYFELNDYDNDGFIDPIIVYGTRTRNGTSDGRIKILTYHKGKKRAIRHQNGTLDSQRNTQVDKLYYKLPFRIQKRVNQIMVNITKNNHGIFPYRWQNSMKNKKLKFDEY